MAFHCFLYVNTHTYTILFCSLIVFCRRWFSYRNCLFHFSRWLLPFSLLVSLFLIFQNSFEWQYMECVTRCDCMTSWDGWHVAMEESWWIERKWADGTIDAHRYNNIDGDAINEDANTWKKQMEWWTGTKRWRIKKVKFHAQLERNRYNANISGYNMLYIFYKSFCLFSFDSTCAPSVFLRLIRDIYILYSPTHKHSHTNTRSHIECFKFVRLV